jgi:hypothetical protein
MIKNFQIFENKKTNKFLLDTINDFLVRILPKKYTSKIYSGTINITDLSINDKKAKAIAFYYISMGKDIIKINFNCRHLLGSDIVYIQDYIISELRNNIKIVVKNEIDHDSNYTYTDIVYINFDDFDNVVDVLNNSPSDKLELYIMSRKYNL